MMVRKRKQETETESVEWCWSFLLTHCGVHFSLFPSVALLDDMTAAEHEKTPDWYPRRKLNVVRWKLEGHNPAKILTREVRENRNVVLAPKLLEKVCEHLKGEGKRAQLDGIRTPQEQVELILDMAKDPNILGRTWVGWGPFI
jgi:hypothetical protein